MSTVEQIAEKTRALPAPLQEEALHYIDYLIARQTQHAEASAWARFSAEQLAGQYAPEDAIYDRD
jgi:predicted transcriptional regulator